MEDKKMFLGALELKNDLVKQHLCNSCENNNFFVRDRYDFENNQIIKKTGMNILTGDENWRFDLETKTFAYYQENKFNENGLGKYDTMMCNYFRWQPFNLEVKPSMFQGNDKGEIMFRYENCEDIEIFKNWIKEKYQQGHPVQILFALQYPNIIQKEKIYNWNTLNMPKLDFNNMSIISNNEKVQPILTTNSRGLYRK